MVSGTPITGRLSSREFALIRSTARIFPVDRDDGAVDGADDNRQANQSAKMSPQPGRLTMADLADGSRAALTARTAAEGVLDI